MIKMQIHNLTVYTLENKILIIFNSSKNVFCYSPLLLNWPQHHFFGCFVPADGFDDTVVGLVCFGWICCSSFLSFFRCHVIVCVCVDRWWCTVGGKASSNTEYICMFVTSHFT